MALSKVQKFSLMVGAAIFAIIVFYSIFKPFIVIRPGNVAVIENKFTGMEERVLRAGFHFLIPVVQRPEIYSTQIQTYTMSSVSEEGQRKGDDSLVVLTSDGQPVTIDMTVKYRLDEKNVWKLHNDIGINFEDKIIRPSLRGTIRLVVSKYSVVELYSSNPRDIAKTLGLKEEDLKGKQIGRYAVQADMFGSLSEELFKHFIVITEVNIRDIKFSPEYQQAIEQKQVAQQDAERMNYVLEKSKKEKEQKIIDAEAVKESKIIQAQGEAEAITKVGDALRRNPNVISYEYVQKLSPNVKAIIADNKTILSISELIK